MCFLIETILKPAFSRLFEYLVIPSKMHQSVPTPLVQTNWERDFEINVAYRDDLDGNDSAASSVIDSRGNYNCNLRNGRRTGFKKQCLTQCQCGNKQHIAKISCDKCGRQRMPKSIDWKLMKKKAPKSAHMTTRRVFERICQLHAAHGHDVVVLVHKHDRQGRKFKVWGTPGAGQRFLAGNMGNAIRDAWKCHVEVVNGAPKKTGQMADQAIDKASMETASKRVEKSAGVNSRDDDQSSASDTDSDVYEVENVLGVKFCDEDGVFKYHIKWKGFSDDVNTWEPEENIIDKSLLKPFR